MRADDRETLRTRFHFRCGYCGVREADVGAELTLDHFQPQSRGGKDEPRNWVYCCHACNEFKGDFWESQSPHRILHPLDDELAIHITEDDEGRLLPLTETGSFHINRLRLNRPALLAHRREVRLLAKARQTQASLLSRLAEFDHQFRLLTDQLRQLEGDVRKQ